MEIIDQLRFVTDLAPLYVGVFNAQHEVSAGVAGEEPVVKSGAGIAHMEHSSRGGSKAHPCGWVRHKSTSDAINESVPSRQRRALSVCRWGERSAPLVRARVSSFCQWHAPALHPG